MSTKINDRIKIINQNVQGLKGNNKKKKVLEWAKRKNFDIMTIQEAHIEEKCINDWRDVWKGNILYSCGTNKSKGVAILIKENLEHEVMHEEKDKEGRWIVATLKMKGVLFTIANYYGPNDDDPKHLNNMLEEINKIEPGKLIIAGDFNLVLNIHLDKKGGLPRTHFKCQKALKNWMEEEGVSDIWRLKNPDKRKYTWISNTKEKIMSRLDFILISDSLQPTYTDSDIVPGYMSDHACTTLTLKIPNEERGKGFWKYNSKLSEIPELKDQIRETIKQTIEENEGTDDCLLWDLLKCKIRGTCIGLASKRNKEKKERMNRLEKDLQTLEESLQNAIMNNKETNNLENQIFIKKTERDNMIKDKVDGDAIRCKIDWHEEGHMASKMFLNLEKSKGEAKTIRKIKDNDGKIITGTENILRKEEEFYREIYKSKKKKLDHQSRKEEEEIWETGGAGNKLKETEHPELIAPITEKEVWDIIKTSPQRKSPGTDGFTTEFYKEFWPLIKTYLVNSLNMGLNRGYLNII
jgi:exonuclease III